MVKKGSGKAKAVKKLSPKGFEKEIMSLSEHELKEMLMINMYKMAILRAQLEAVTNVLIKHKLASYEEIWKETNENFKNTV